MGRVLLALVVALSATLASVGGAGARPSGPDECTFELGFARFREALGADYVGACEESQLADEDGNVHQQTSRGKLSWEAATNRISYRERARLWFAGDGSLDADVVVTGLPDQVPVVDGGEMPVPSTMRVRAASLLKMGSMGPDDLGEGWIFGVSPLMMPRTYLPSCDPSGEMVSLGSVQTWLLHRPSGQIVSQTLGAVPEWEIGPVEEKMRSWVERCNGTEIESPLGSFVMRMSLARFTPPGDEPPPGDEALLQRIEAEVPGIDETFVAHALFVRYGGLMSIVVQDQRGKDADGSEEAELAVLMELAQQAESRIGRTAYVLSRLCGAPGAMTGPRSTYCGTSP